MKCYAAPRNARRRSRSRHKRQGALRDRVVNVAEMRRPAHEGDRAGDLVALAPGIDRRALRRRLEIVDPKVERRHRPEMAARDPYRHAGASVDQADDRTRGQYPAFGDPDQLLAPWQRQLDPVVAMAATLHADGAAVADLPGELEEALGVESGARCGVGFGGGFVHASIRSAVRRTSEIMLGMPCVRLELNWRDRSNG